MERLAASRDAILTQSNRFLIAGMVFAVFYGVKALGMRLDLVFFDTRIFEIPYGLFIFCIAGSGSFLIAQSRFIDATSIDRRLYLTATLVYPDMHREYYQTFPSQNSWLDVTREQFFPKDHKLGAGLSSLFSLVGIILLFLYFLPVFACLHFLINWPGPAGEEFTILQWWIVLVCLAIDIIFFIFVQKVYALSSQE